MRLPRPRVSLTGQVMLFSLLPVVLLGFALGWVMRDEIVSRTLADAARSARLVARLGAQPRLTPGDLRHGMSAKGVRELDEQLRARSASRDLARIKIWNSGGTIVYSDKHSLIGTHPQESDELRSALEGHPNAATVVTPTPGSETAGEVGLGRLVEVYVPLRFSMSGRPAGAFEIYLSYAPIAAAIGADERTIAALIALGLALLWGTLYRIVSSVSRRLRRQSRENDRLARYDLLTGLPNRTLFSERVHLALHEAHAGSEQVAVLLLDLDGFKQINDTLGHSSGDAVLLEVARRLRALDVDLVVARVGDDEYAVLQRGAQGKAGALHAATSIREMMQEPVALPGAEVNVEVSIGIAIAPDHAVDAETLVRRADMALAQAQEYRSAVEVSSAQDERVQAARLKLLGQVRPALEREELVLFYQPKIELAGGRVSGAEALLRWRHPQRGVLAPSEFMPVIERSALIGELARYVIERAVRQLASWRRQGLEVEVAVNLSACNLHDQALPVDVERLLRAHAVPASALTVEVTETVAMTDAGRAMRVLGALRKLGVGVSIDDFGSGHASISYLSRLPATELKIDRSLVAGVGERRRDEALVQTTVDLARHFGLKIVAEGIESRTVAERLAAMGCDIGQGYFIARPMPAEELLPWIEQRAEGPPHTDTAVLPDRL